MGGSSKRWDKLKDWMEWFFTVAVKILLIPILATVIVLITMVLIWLLSKLGIIFKELSQNNPFPLIGNALLSLSNAPWTEALLNILLMATATIVVVILLIILTQKLFSLIKTGALTISKSLVIALSILCVAVFLGVLDNVTAGAISSFVSVTFGGISNGLSSFISAIPAWSAVKSFFSDKWLTLLLITIVLATIFVMVVRIGRIILWVQSNPSLIGALFANIISISVKFLNETSNVLKNMLDKRKAKKFISTLAKFISQTLLMANLWAAIRDFLALALSFLSGSLHNKQTKRFLIIAATAASFASFYTTSEGLYDLLGLQLLSILISMAAQLILLKASLDLGNIVYNNKLIKDEAKKIADKTARKVEIKKNRTSMRAAILAVAFTMAISTSFSYVQLFYLAHKTMSGYNAYKSYIKAECSDILTGKILKLEKAFSSNQQEILADLITKQKTMQGWNKTVENAHNVANGVDSPIKWTFDTPFFKFKYISISFDHALDIVVDIVNNRQYNDYFTLATTVVKSSWQPVKGDASNKALQYEYNLYDIKIGYTDSPTAAMSADVPSAFAQVVFDAAVHAENYKGYEICNMVITEMLKQYAQLEGIYLSTNDIWSSSKQSSQNNNTSTVPSSGGASDDANTRSKLAENIEIARFFASNTQSVKVIDSQDVTDDNLTQNVRDISYNYRASVLSLLSDVEKDYKTSIKKYPQIESSAEEISGASTAIKDSYIISKLLIEETLSILYTLPISNNDIEQAKENDIKSTVDFSKDLKDSINHFVGLSRKVDDRFSKHILASEELIYAINPFPREEATNIPRYRMWSLILLSMAILLDLLSFISGYFLAGHVLLAQRALAKPAGGTTPKEGEEIEDTLHQLFDPGVGNNSGESLKLIKAIMSRQLTLNGGKATMAINSIPKVSRWQLAILSDLKLIEIKGADVVLTAEFLTWMAEFKNSNSWLFVD